MFIQDSRFLDNVAEHGAGILDDGELKVVSTLFKNNSANYGGGIENCGGGIVTITNSQFLENHAKYIGSAIYNRNSDWVDECGIEGSPGTVNISNTVFSENHAGGAGTILNDEKMNIEFSTIHNNEAEHDGGGIANAGTLNIVASTITSNTVNANNGGAIHQFNGTVTISHSLIENNMAVNGGGGIAIWGGTATIENSAVVSNTAESGGGIYVKVDGEYPINASMTIKNSTISGNLAVGLDADGGGGGVKAISPTSKITITQSTIANNDAPNQTGRDGIWQVDGSVLIQQSIVAENGTENCTQDGGVWEGSTYSLADDASCVGFMEADPQLTQLGDYGGDTLTHALLLGSPAVDAGDNTLCLARDQRGEIRPMDGNGDGTAVCDIGAVEINFWPWQIYLPIIVR